MSTGYPNFLYSLLSHTWLTPVPYLYGGWTEAGWDCSGFIGYVLSGWNLVLPGMFKGVNGYTENVIWNPLLGYHPPPADSYKSWRSAKTVTDGTTLPGDLLVWDTHIGVAIGPEYMVSALSSAYATAVTPITGFGPGNETMVQRRIKAGLVS